MAMRVGVKKKAGEVVRKERAYKGAALVDMCRLLLLLPPLSLVRRVALPVTPPHGPLDHFVNRTLTLTLFHALSSRLARSMPTKKTHYYTRIHTGYENKTTHTVGSENLDKA